MFLLCCLEQLGYPDDYDGSFWLNTPGYYAPIWQGEGLCCGTGASLECMA